MHIHHSNTHITKSQPYPPHPNSDLVYSILVFFFDFVDLICFFDFALLIRILHIQCRAKRFQKQFAGKFISVTEGVHLQF